MFYSHSFLSRKGPLGAVWIAAHLHNRLRKSHVASANISASVDHIMSYEIPIALRLSGHLLLGVARIYSKKVDYLYEDCNEVLTQLSSAFASVQVNLPEHASHAPFHSITLPEAFELDACDIDDAMHIAEGPDDHIKAYEEITITDQIPAEGNPYIALLICEGSKEDIFQTRTLNDALEPMDKDACLPITPFLGGNGDEHIHDLSPSNQADEFNKRPLKEHSPQDLPEIEILRDAVQYFRLGSLPEWLNLGAEFGEQQEPFDPITNKKDGLSPITKGLLLSRREYVPSRSHPLVSAAGSVEVPETFGSKLSFGVPEIALQPSLPVKKRKARPQKEKKLIRDDTLVLLNKTIREQLRDASHLKRRRKTLPVGRIDVQRSYKSSQGEQMFLEPSVSGMCSELQEIFKKDNLSPNDGSVRRVAQSPANMVRSVETEDIQTNGESFTVSPLSETQTHVPHGHLQSPSTKSSCERETETPLHGEDTISGNLTEFMRSPSLTEGFAPSSAGTLDSVSLSGKTQETKSLRTPELPEHRDLGSLSAGSVEQASAKDAAQPYIPFMLNSEEDDLNFLETNTVLSGHEGNEVGTLTGRSRAVVQYLKMQIPISQISEDQPYPLSLRRILQRKTRKQCAFMFFETMVLASYRFINVQQEAAFGDISVFLTPVLSKVKL